MVKKFKKRISFIHNAANYSPTKFYLLAKEKTTCFTIQ